jgi:hypothetical protein
MNLQSIEKLNDLLSDFLSPQITEILTAYGSGETSDQYFVNIPESDAIDMTMADLASLVARTSNVYGRVTRFAGMARAHYKICEGKYKKVYKSNRTGKNEAEREANALEAAEEQYTAMVTSESIVQLAESMEGAARIASESARKLLDKAQSMQIASYREEKGSYLDSDFSTY